jgi:hypothetical protein
MILRIANNLIHPAPHRLSTFTYQIYKILHYVQDDKQALKGPFNRSAIKLVVKVY